NDEFVKANEENIKVCFDVPNYGLWLFLNEAGAEYKDGKWEIIEDMVNTNIGKTWPQFVVGTALQKYLTGQETAEKAVEWAQKEMERIIQESEEEK
ncbi:MAG: hypothetical protein H5T85_06220, partial [Actinobacteria bacterium]|nr:hypothetical protein [Actinomycetota bacterium]